MGALVPACASRAALPIGSPAHAAEPPRLPPLAPGQRVRGGSLFRTDVVGLETGFALTADAAPGSTLTLLDPHVPAAPELRAGNPTAAALSPDGRTLVVLTSGFNLTYDERGKEMSEGSQQWAFVYDVTAGAPRETDVLPIPNTFGGLAWDPRGHRFWVSGGPDDAVYEIARERDAWRRLPPIPLGHLDEKQRGGRGLDMGPYAAGIAANASGTLLAVANHENDSLTIVDAVTRAKVREVPLWPGGGARGGGYPFDVVFVGDELAYATSQRDREVVEVDAVAGSVTRRIRVRGQPVRVVSDREGERLFVANANADTVSVIDRARGLVEDEIATTAPDAVAFRGSSPNAIALSPNESMLYVTNGGNNTLAVISLARRRTIGLVPTGFYPHAVAVSRDGGWLYVAHGKSPAGPNPFGPWSDAARAKQKYDAPGLHNQFSLQLQMGGLLSFPRPAPADLEKLTLQSLANNRIGVRSPTPNLDALAGKIKHVVYVLAENRTYDQILGDLPGADGEPLLVHWGERITPNQHALAREFVTFDRFFVSGGVSGDGWQWSTCARTTDVTEKVLPLQYARRGRHSYDWEGTNRNVNVAIPTTARRRALNPDSPDDDDVLPGVADVAAPDGPEEGGTGFLWDAALRAGLSVRNYGFFLDYWRYNRGEDHPARIPTLRMPFESRTRVAIPARASLERVTDPYFRGFDMRFPDFWRFKEWEREFDEQVARGEMPALSLVRLPHDHLGSFHDALDGLDTPDTQMADHDYALGLLVEKIARSPFWKDTVIVAMEDDAQNGSDHVDAHRSLIFFAGAHVKRGAVISTPHTTPDVLRTIELLLGLPPLAQQDAFARPIDEVFTTDASLKPFQAIVPSVLRTTKLPLPPAPEGETADRPRGDAATWALVTRGMDFNRTDAAPAAELNRALWCGLVDATGCTSSAAFASIDED